MSYPYHFYAIVIPGLEVTAAKELEELSAHEVRTDSGGVYFSGTMETMFRVNLRSRCITRVLLRLKRFTAMTLDGLRDKVEKIAWGDFLSRESAISVHVSCHSSRLMHTSKIENEIHEVIRKAGFSLNPGETGQQVFIRIENNRCLLSIDTSGERLDRRGYRLESGKAPVRETLAAGVLQWMEWSRDETLLVPMCGSGTFAIEAAMMGIKQAPGMSHDFPFLTWPQLKRKGWERIFKRTQAMIRDDASSLSIYASDINPAAIEIAARNADRAGVKKMIHMEKKDLKELSSPGDAHAGLIVCNPPYGQRIDTNVHALYATLGKIYKKDFSHWRMVVFSPDHQCEKHLGLSVKRRLKIKHGGKWVNILHV
ncbi:MAG: class I SAM-dependent RNA methyltransferase [Mariprofundaceae bacterium]|nr:class I SAM-dependent RNA methyltransferase [Mariprofundaceae bacterium]